MITHCLRNLTGTLCTYPLGWYTHKVGFIKASWIWDDSLVPSTVHPLGYLASIYTLLPMLKFPKENCNNFMLLFNKTQLSSTQLKTSSPFSQRRHRVPVIIVLPWVMISLWAMLATHQILLWPHLSLPPKRIEDIWSCKNVYMNVNSIIRNSQKV